MARDRRSLLHLSNIRRVHAIVREQAKRAGIRMDSYRVRGSFIHLLLRAGSREDLARFLRAVTGLIARLCLQRERGAGRTGSESAKGSRTKRDSRDKAELQMERERADVATKIMAIEKSPAALATKKLVNEKTSSRLGRGHATNEAVESGGTEIAARESFWLARPFSQEVATTSIASLRSWIRTSGDFALGFGLASLTLELPRAPS